MTSRAFVPSDSPSSSGRRCASNDGSGRGARLRLRDGMHVGRIALLLLLIATLSSCYIPEAFTATLNIGKDYRYLFEYDGVVAFGPALGEIAKKGSLSATDETQLRQSTTSTFKQEDGFDRATYQGKARWKVHFKKAGTIGTKTDLFGESLPIVTLRRQNDGGVTLEGMTVDTKIAQELMSVHFVIDGKLNVTTDMKVVRHNATETPQLLGLIGHYGWSISSAHLTAPAMTLQPLAASTGSGSPSDSGGSINLTTVSGIPPFIVGCSSLLSASQTDFVAKRYLYVDDLGEQASIWIGNRAVLLKKNETNDPSYVSAYSNGEWTAYITIERSLGKERGAEIVVGKLTVKHKGGKAVTRSFYGQRGC